MKMFHGLAISAVTLDADVAASCIYHLPRGGKTIEGPSIRLAEILASAYGNFRVQSEIIEEGKSFITARATAWDLETNYSVSQTCRRRITDKNGRRFNDDMIGVTGAAAMSIAFRNAVFKAIPRVFYDPVLNKAIEVVKGDEVTLPERRKKMLSVFATLGIKPEKLCERVEKRAIEDMTIDDVYTLRSLFTAIKEGEIDIATAFPDKVIEVATGATKSEKMAGKLKQRAEQQPETAVEPEKAPAGKLFDGAPQDYAGK